MARKTKIFYTESVSVTRMNEEDKEDTEVDPDSYLYHHGDMGGGIHMSPRVLFHSNPIASMSTTTYTVPRPIQAIVEQVVVLSTTTSVIVLSDDLTHTFTDEIHIPSQEYEIVDPSDRFTNLIKMNGTRITDVCPICYDPFEPDAGCIRLSGCHHIFHAQCIRDAVKHQNLVCPVCRHGISLSLKK